MRLFRLTNIYHLTQWLCVLAILLIASALLASAAYPDHSILLDTKNTNTDPELNWPDDDEQRKALQVNEGALAFLSTPPGDKATHTVTNNLTISNDSLKSHWVNLYQCHRNLDPVAASEIVYNYHHMRNLRIEHYYGMNKAWIDQQSVQMQAIEKGASLCVTAEVQILEPTGNGEFRLRNGPYFRKFLDGYYPFHLMLKINYPSAALSLRTTRPEQQTGVKVFHNEGKLSMDAWFEGKLMVEARFASVQ